MRDKFVRGDLENGVKITKVNGGLIIYYKELCIKYEQNLIFFNIALTRVSKPGQGQMLLSLFTRSLQYSWNWAANMTKIGYLIFKYHLLKRSKTNFMVNCEKVKFTFVLMPNTDMKL